MDVQFQLGTNKSSSSYLLSSSLSRCCNNNTRIRNEVLLLNNFLLPTPRFNQRRRIIITTTTSSIKRRKNSNFRVYSSSSSDANNQPQDEEDKPEEDSFKRLTGGFDFDDANAKLSAFRHSLSQFISWNHFTQWKDISNWDPTRVGVFAIYAFVTLLSLQRIYIAVRAPFLNRQAAQVSQAYMDALIPDPTPANIRKYKKGLWRKSMPKGLKMKKFIEGPEGTLIHDTSYVGEDAWDDEDDDDATVSKNKVKEIIDRDGTLNTENKSKLQEELGLSDVNQESGRTWQERLHIWKDVLKKEELAERLDSSRAKYAIEFDMKEVEKSFREDAKVKSEGPRALWISKRWWRYRPKLPYTYFLEKLECSEVAAVVFTEDLKTLYVTMNEGFPLEYVVDMPLDPYLFEMITNSGAEVDLLQKKQSHYLLKVVIALLPGILILWFLRESLMLLHITSKRFLYKKYNQLFDMAYAENFILPVREVDDTKSMYKDVVLGGDVWDLLDELMIYMRNPMQYYEKEVKFVRGVLLSGPPGTGKTLFARTLAKESGMPFVFASGAEFTDSEKSGAARINQMFSIARRNAPAFIFVDEIDAIAGRHARKDPRRRSTFDALIAQLDGEKEKTGVDRFSLRQAVIFICATNRPDELDLEFVQAGRIDRRLYIGLPDAKQRVQIFGVHSTGKQLAEDVEFEKLVFRTVGYSGADIRNLVNEAGIMAVRRGHTKIYQKDIVIFAACNINPRNPNEYKKQVQNSTDMKTPSRIQMTISTRLAL